MEGNVRILSLTDRVALLEETCHLHSGRMDMFEKEIKIILTEVHVIINWIQKHFASDLASVLPDVQLINKNSEVHKNHGNMDGLSSTCMTAANNNIVSNETLPTLAQAILQNKAEIEECQISDFQKVTSAEKSFKEIESNKNPKARKWSIIKRNVVDESHSDKGKPNKDVEVKGDLKGKPPVQCDECGKVLKGPGSLRAHMRTHSNVRPHQCTQCGKAFRMKHHLEFHLLVHSGDKKESCCFCGKSFLVKRDLLRHERTHTGERPFSCSFCPKSFNVKQHLTLHIRTHTGERPYKCTICEKKFTQANSLRIHKKIHFKETVDESVLSDEKKKCSANSNANVYSDM